MVWVIAPAIVAFALAVVFVVTAVIRFRADPVAAKDDLQIRVRPFVAILWVGIGVTLILLRNASWEMFWWIALPFTVCALLAAVWVSIWLIHAVRHRRPL